MTDNSLQGMKDERLKQWKLSRNMALTEGEREGARARVAEMDKKIRERKNTSPGRRQHLHRLLVNDRARQAAKLEDPSCTEAERQKATARIAEIDAHMEEHFSNYPGR